MSNGITFSKNFADELSRVTDLNDSTEITLIIEELNSKKFSDHVQLSRELNKLVRDRLDPVNVRETTEKIFIDLLPEHRILFEPVSVIVSTSPAERSSGCFLRRRVSR